jgi:cytochrome c6
MKRSVWMSAAVALFLAAAAFHSSAQTASSSEVKPAGFAADDIAAGAVQYNRTCAQCHGRNMVNSGTTSYDLRRFPVDQLDRFLLAVNKGKGNMPSFDSALTPEQIRVLWAYVGSRGGKEP